MIFRCLNYQVIQRGFQKSRFIELSLECQRGLLQTFSHYLLFIAQTFRRSVFFIVQILQSLKSIPGYEIAT